MKLVVAALICLVSASLWSFGTSLELRRPAIVTAQPQRASAALPQDRGIRATRADEPLLPVAVAADERAPLEEDLEQAEAEDDELIAVRGTVLGERDEVVPGAWVEVVPRSGDDPTPHEAAVGEDGTFEAHVPIGTYEVVARAPGFVPDSADSIGASGVEASIDGIALTLRQGLTVRGKVFEGRDLVDGVDVRLEGGGYRLSATATGGEFEFTGLPPGAYRVAAHLPGVGGDSREVQAGETTTLTLATRALGGVVVDSSGRPAAFAQVLVRAKALFTDAADADPFGPFDHPAGHPTESVAPCSYGGCESYVTDERGAFEAQVPQGAALTVGALSEEGELGVLDEISPTARSAFIRLQKPTFTRIRVMPEAPAEGGEEEEPSLPYAIYVGGEGFFGDAEDEVPVGEDGVVTVQSFAGMPLEIERPWGGRFEPIDPLPPEVRIVDPRDDVEDLPHNRVDILGSTDTDNYHRAW